MKLRDRIKELRRVPASEILPNPKNWRTHPQAQQDALRAVLAEVGIADALLVREAPAGLQLIDGHLRADTAPDALWPCLVLDVTEAEADKLLATVDPLAAMAETDAAKLDELLREVETGSEALAAMLAELVEEPMPLDFEEPPDSVQKNAEELERIKHQRQQGNESATEKNDTERYLIVVYSSRQAKEAALKRLGLPADERYVPAGSVTIKARGPIAPSGKKAADLGKSGACG